MTAAAPLNPPASQLGTINAVMGAAGRTAHHVEHFIGPLSIKFMVRGSGTWRTDAGTHRVEEGWFLVLNHGQTYSLDIAGGTPRESFCPFFRRGFVEDIHRSLTTPDHRLLDDPHAADRPLGFHPHLHRADRRVVPRLRELRATEGDSVVYVRADKKSSYGDVMDVLGRVGESGYGRVSLLSQPKPKPQ